MRAHPLLVVLRYLGFTNFGALHGYQNGYCFAPKHVGALASELLTAHRKIFLEQSHLKVAKLDMDKH